MKNFIKKFKFEKKDEQDGLTKKPVKKSRKGKERLNHLKNVDITGLEFDIYDLE